MITSWLVHKHWTSGPGGLGVRAGKCSRVLYTLVLPIPSDAEERRATKFGVDGCMRLSVTIQRRCISYWSVLSNDTTSD